MPGSSSLPKLHRFFAGKLPSPRGAVSLCGDSGLVKAAREQAQADQGPPHVPVPSFHRGPADEGICELEQTQAHLASDVAALSSRVIGGPSMSAYRVLLYSRSWIDRSSLAALRID